MRNTFSPANSLDTPNTKKRWPIGLCRSSGSRLNMNVLQGGLTTFALLVVALAALGVTLWWAARGERRSRQPILLASVISALLLVIINLVARAMGWWVGPAFEP